jgi:hypothetical protein
MIVQNTNICSGQFSVKYLYCSDQECYQKGSFSGSDY